MFSNRRNKPRKATKEEVSARKTRAIKICEMFSRLGPRGGEKDVEEDTRDTQPHTPLPEITPSLSKKFWDLYGADCQNNLAEILRGSRGPQPSWHFDARPRFYDYLIPLLAKLTPRNATIFRIIQLIETALSHPSFKTKAQHLKHLDPSCPERSKFYFSWWLFEVALPCVVVACEQTEAGTDWKSRVVTACLDLKIPVNPSWLHARCFQFYMFLADHLCSPTYGDITVSVFHKLPMNPDDAMVVRELTEKLLLQQLMYDSELSSHSPNEEMVQAAALMMLGRVQEYLEDLLLDKILIPDYVESLRQIRQSLLQFPRRETCEVRSRLMHIRNSVEQINESAEDGSGQLANLRALIYE